MRYLIRYEYPGMSARGGEPLRPVGTVYVRTMDIGAGFSYTKDPEKATKWPTIDEAKGELFRWESNDAVVVAEEVAGRLSDGSRSQ